jgi:hypothetical protein
MNIQGKMIHATILLWDTQAAPQKILTFTNSIIIINKIHTLDIWRNRHHVTCQKIHHPDLHTYTCSYENPLIFAANEEAAECIFTIVALRND